MAIESVAPLLVGLAVVAGALALAGLWRWGRSRRRPVALAETAERAWTDVAPRTATLRLAVEPDARVSADPERLAVLFAELFDNAVTHGGRDVTVRVERTRDGFAVADDGPGFAPEARDWVLDVGFSTDPDRAGLGLGFAKTLAAAYDWEVTVGESGAGGARVAFSGVSFAPAAAATTEPAGAPEPADERAGW